MSSPVGVGRGYLRIEDPAGLHGRLVRRRAPFTPAGTRFALPRWAFTACSNRPTAGLSRPGRVLSPTERRRPSPGGGGVPETTFRERPRSPMRLRVGSAAAVSAAVLLFAAGCVDGEAPATDGGGLSGTGAGA